MALNLSFSVTLIAAVTLFLLGLFVAFAFDGRRSSKARMVPEPRAVSRLSASDELRQLVEKGGNPHVLMEGGFRLRETFSSPEGFTVRGPLVLEDESQLDGAVEVFGNVSLGVRARSSRPLLVHGDLTLSRDASVPCCRVDGNVFLHPGSKVEGSLECNAVYLIEALGDVPSISDALKLDTPALATS